MSSIPSTYAGAAHEMLAEVDDYDLSVHHREATRVQNRRNVEVGSLETMCVIHHENRRKLFKNHEKSFFYILKNRRKKIKKTWSGASPTPQDQARFACLQLVVGLRTQFCTLLEV